jgi:hypothetical protein
MLLPQSKENTVLALRVYIKNTNFTFIPSILNYKSFQLSWRVKTSQVWMDKHRLEATIISNSQLYFCMLGQNLRTNIMRSAIRLVIKSSSSTWYLAWIGIRGPLGTILLTGLSMLLREL